MKLDLRLCAVAALVCFAVSAAHAEEMTGKQIVQKMRDVATYKDSYIKLKMTLVNRLGEKRERMLINRTAKIDGLGKTVTTFLYPDDVKGTKFLVEQAKGGGDDIQKIYLPEMDKIRRISSSQKNESFLGTDFTFGDFQSRDPDKGTHKNIGAEKMDGFDCWIVESIPNADEDSQYSKINSWVRKDNYLPVRVKFFDKEGNQIKELTTAQHYKQDGLWIAKTTTMQNLKKGSKTIIEVVEQKNNTGLSPDFFTERFLKDKTQN